MINENVINFFSRKKEFRSLSNYWESEVIIKNNNISRVYESGEHCFHGEKYIRIGELCLDINRKKDLIEYGITFSKPSIYTSCSQVKKMGGKNGFLLNDLELDQWATTSIQVQKQICKYKFENYDIVRNDLKKSGNKILIHPAMRCSEEKIKNRIWEGKAVIKDGQINVLGKNTLGKMWMELRKKIIQ